LKSTFNPLSATKPLSEGHFSPTKVIFHLTSPPDSCKV